MAIIRTPLSECKTIKFIATSDIGQGDIVNVGSVYGISIASFKTGERASVVVEANIVEVDSVADNYQAGEKVYLNPATKKVDKTTNTNPLVGIVYEDSGPNATKIKVLWRN